MPALSPQQIDFFRAIQSNELRRQELDSQVKVKELERRLHELTAGAGASAEPVARAGNGNTPTLPEFALLSTFGDSREMQAVVAVRGGGQVTVRAGDTLPGEWRVSRVGSYRVVLARGGERKEIVFGGGGP